MFDLFPYRIAQSYLADCLREAERAVRSGRAAEAPPTGVSLLVRAGHGGRLGSGAPLRQRRDEAARSVVSAASAASVMKAPV